MNYYIVPGICVSQFCNADPRRLRRFRIYGPDGVFVLTGGLVGGADVFVAGVDSWRQGSSEWEYWWVEQQYLLRELLFSSA